MEPKGNTILPIIGKTYSLYGGSPSSDNFYEHLSLTADKALTLTNKTEEELIQFISSLSSSKMRIKKEQKKSSLVSEMILLLRKDLAIYIGDLKAHLNSLTLIQRMYDKSLAASFEQYLLYMLEIELNNRTNLQKFSVAGIRMAFLPHCLRDFSRECLSLPDEVDNLCRRCSKKCTINSISTLLKKNEITPYIWLKADLKKLFLEYRRRNELIGVLGIACIPELVNGMRLCRKAGVPVIGIPLDANRCRRWMGDFYNNSINTLKLERILEEMGLAKSH